MTVLPRLPISTVRLRIGALTERLAARWFDTPPAWRWACIGGALAACTAPALAIVLTVLADLPDATSLRVIGVMPEATVAFDRHDEPAFALFREQRIDVPLARISPHLTRAVVAVEDRRFFHHGGIDLVRVAGAAVANIRNGGVIEGGSTITQQLARMAFLSPERTLRRKLREAVLARRLERMYTKVEILELYLNKVYFGGGFYGAEAASLGYFGKHAVELDVAEAALLAGLVRAPSAYAPTMHLERALARREIVLRAMQGEALIDDATLEAARAKDVTLVNALRPAGVEGHYFREEVRQRLVEWFGVDRVLRGGLRVYTTLDPVMQAAAEREVSEGLAAIERRQEARASRDETAGPLQAALVALDPATGHVRALVGGRDFTESHFNRAVQAHRQPGSAFKPFVYAAALEHGYSAATRLTELDAPIATIDGTWVPADGHAETTAMTMRDALRLSSNRAAAWMLQEVGIPEAVRLARGLGLGSLPGVPSLALGSGEVTLLAMTRAFGAFAHGGLVTSPTLIRRVETANGELLYDASDRATRAVSGATAYIVTSMLADVLDAGTGWQVRKAGFTRPAAGKTGTTNDFHDAWFIGYTPHLAAGIWIGYDRPRTIVGNGYAAELAAPVWGRFMTEATRDDPPTAFTRPGDIVSRRICSLSGARARDACREVAIGPDGAVVPASRVRTEFFARGTEPDELCPLHGRTRGFWSWLFGGDAGTGEESADVPPPPSFRQTPEAGR